LPRYHRYKSDSFRDGDGLITVDLPRPIAADLNGDGKPEIIAAVPGGRLHVLAPREHGNGFAPALLLGEVDLQEVWKDLGKNALESQEVVALTVGYLTAKTKEFVRSPRKAVIGLVTSTGSVLLLDHNLKTLWIKELKHNVKDDRSWHLDQASILVTEHAGNTGDKGTVVVGARIKTVDSKGVVDKLLEKHEGHGRDRLEGLREVDGDSSHQYSYYAFNGNAGERKWQHRPSDFHPEIAGFQHVSLPTESSLHAQAQLNEGTHHGETSCRNYRESILRALPHVWNAHYDSKLVLSHFRRHRSHSGQQKHTVGQAQMNHERFPSKFDPQLVPEPSSGSIRGRKRMQFHPNVVLAHTEEGIEALHLYSGRTVCRLPLQSGVVHADVNGDGIPDHIHAVGGNLRGLMHEAASEGTDVIGSHNRLLYCSATVSSGIPTRYRLWNGTICRHTVLGLHSASRDGIVLGVAPAAVLPDYGSGRKLSQEDSLRRRNNVYFLNSVGDLSGYSSRGELLWQVSTGATWHVVPVGEDGHIIIDSDQDPDNSKENPSTEVPTLLSMTLRRHSTPTVILAAGSSYAAIVSERGHILASLSLPSYPIQPLSTIDFNLDGYMDIVLVAKEGLYGWTQVRRPGSVSFGGLVACLIVVMLAVFITQQSFGGQHEETTREDGFMAKTRTARGRSTDRID
jgi:hypothetical protein